MAQQGKSLETARAYWGDCRLFYNCFIKLTFMLKLSRQCGKERRSSNLTPNRFSADYHLQSHILISLRLPCSTSVNEATNAFYRHPVLSQMSVSIESALTIAESKRSVFVRQWEDLRFIEVVFFIPGLEGVCVL